MSDKLEYKQMLTNLKGWACWDFKSYPLKETEARILIEALEECIQRREKNEKQ